MNDIAHACSFKGTNLPILPETFEENENFIRSLNKVSAASNSARDNKRSQINHWIVGKSCKDSVVNELGGLENMTLKRIM